jgi:hypothetical protein
LSFFFITLHAPPYAPPHSLPAHVRRVRPFFRRNAVDEDDYDDTAVSVRLPERGEYVDSIGYYGRELSAMNERVAGMQREKIDLAKTGDDPARASRWISHAIDRVSAVAESTLVRAVPVLSYEFTRLVFFFLRPQRLLRFRFRHVKRDPPTVKTMV